MENLEISEFSKALRVLPRKSLWNILGLDVQVSFDRSESLVALCDVPGTDGFQVESTWWHHIFIFGEMFIPGGASPFFAVDERDGRILHVDLEYEVPLSLLNCSLNLFIASFLALTAVSFSDPTELRRTAVVLEHIDPVAFRGGSGWKLLVEHLISGGDAI